MNFSLVDAGSLALSTLSHGPLLVLPGLALAALSGVLDLAATSDDRKAATGLLVGSGLLPVLDALATRFVGLDRSDGIPIALPIRAFMPVDASVAPGVWRMALRLLCLPINYAAEFGVSGVGAVLFWIDRKRDADRAADGAPTDLARVLTIGALTGLALGTFFQSLLFAGGGQRIGSLP